MKSNLPLISTPRRKQTLPARRRQLLAAFEHSGLTAAAFAQEHGIAYTTFCAWRRRSAAKPSVSFAEVAVVGPPSAEPIVVELGRQARMRLSSREQLELAAALLKQLEASC